MINQAASRTGQSGTSNNQLPVVRRGYVDCRFGQMHYRSAGPDRSVLPGVLLLHQNPASGFEYESLIAELATDRRVIAFDTPGYGMSDSPPGVPGIADYAAAFSDGLDALAQTDELAGPVDLYGFHTGAILAAELAIRRSDRVRRTVVTGIPMYPAEVRAEKLSEMEAFPAPDEAGEVVLGLLGRLWTYVVTNRDPGVPLAKAVLNYGDKARVLDRFTCAYRAVWSWDYERLRQIPCPVLVLQPDEVLREVSLAAARLIPAVEVRELPDLDRDIFDLAPERLAHEIRLFLD